MNRYRILLAAFVFAASVPPALIAQDHGAMMKDANHAMIMDALSATTPAMAMDATVVDWENNVLKEGSNGWVCFPTPEKFEKAPMCLDETWLSWAQAWMTKGDVNIDQVGLAYMLAGDSGASNSDPYADSPTDDWVVGGPHLMIIVPDPAMLAGIGTDPDSGGPWVMWEGTEYAHVMVPLR
jgi:hypothetical protein